MFAAAGGSLITGAKVRECESAELRWAAKITPTDARGIRRRRGVREAARSAAGQPHTAGEVSSIHGHSMVRAVGLNSFAFTVPRSTSTSTPNDSTASSSRLSLTFVIAISLWMHGPRADPKWAATLGE